MSPRSASMPSGLRRSSARRCRISATTWPTSAMWIRGSARSPISTGWSRGRMRWACASSSTRSGAIPRMPTPGSRRAAKAGATTPRIGTSGPIRSKTARRPTTGFRCSAARPGPGSRAGASTISIISLRRSRRSICATRTSQRRSSRRRGSGSRAASTGSGSMRSISCCTIRSSATIRRDRPLAARCRQNCSACSIIATTCCKGT